MDDMIVKQALAYDLAADLHAEWCKQELYEFFLRAQQQAKNYEYFRQMMEAACYKENKKRNEVSLDSGYLGGHETYANRCLSDFNVFLSLVKVGAIEVKRFTKRNLTKEEISRMDNNYRDGEENILRDFASLSKASQNDNLEAAKIAIELVYDKTISGEKFTPEETEEMASFIHEEWLKRNDWVFDPEYGNPKLAVPYAQLSKEEQDKDKAQLGPAQAKVQAYADGLINIEEKCLQYNLTAPGKQI